VQCPRWGRGMLLLLLSSCVFPGRMAGQTGPRNIDPPEKFRFCVRGADGGKESCETDSWVEDHYIVEGSRDELDYVIITQWSGGKFVIRRNYRFVMPGNVSTRGMDPNTWMECSGQIAASGDRTEHGVISGPMNEGTCSLTWDPRSSSRAIAKSVVERQETAALWAKENERIRMAFAGAPAHRVNGILVPAGASDVFASYPDDVRAILLPEHPLTLDPTRPCDDSKEDDTGTGVTDPVAALEIGRFALRRGEYKRGHCWINHSAYLDKNPRAMTLLGVIHLMDWGSKDPQKAFRYFDGEFQTHDLWALYFVEQCYKNGVGVEKNVMRASQIDTALMMRDDGQQLFLMIGMDDAAVAWREKRAAAILDAPTTPKSTCTRGPVTNPRTGAITYQETCNTTYETDQEALQRQLDRIDQQYQNQTKQK